MTANELRIGNWVYHDGELVQCSGYLISNFANGFVSSPVGVPLTTEILLACGFGFINDNHDRYGWYLYISENRCLCWCHSEEVNLEFIKNDSDYNHTLFDFKIQHLHTLQNVYYFLTGQELEFNNELL